MSKDDDKTGDGTNTGVVVKARPKTKKPAMYKVIMLNDDYTPMEFVVHVLERFFSKNRDEATTIMMHVHQRGVGICGVYTYEVAETKVTQVMDFARQHQHANERSHEYATLEHLLYALTTDQDAIAVMRACDVDVERLRGDLAGYIDNDLMNLIGGQEEEAKPTAGFQRVVQRAVYRQGARPDGGPPGRRRR